MTVTKCQYCGMYMPSETNVERHHRAVHAKIDDIVIDNVEE